MASGNSSRRCLRDEVMGRKDGEDTFLGLQMLLFCSGRHLCAATRFQARWKATIRRCPRSLVGLFLAALIQPYNPYRSLLEGALACWTQGMGRQGSPGPGRASLSLSRLALDPRNQCSREKAHLQELWPCPQEGQIQGPWPRARRWCSCCKDRRPRQAGNVRCWSRHRSRTVAGCPTPLSAQHRSRPWPRAHYRRRVLPCVLMLSFRHVARRCPQLQLPPVVAHGMSHRYHRRFGLWTRSWSPITGNPSSDARSSQLWRSPMDSQSRQKRHVHGDHGSSHWIPSLCSTPSCWYSSLFPTRWLHSTQLDFYTIHLFILDRLGRWIQRSLRGLR